MAAISGDSTTIQEMFERSAECIPCNSMVIQEIFNLIPFPCLHFLVNSCMPGQLLGAWRRNGDLLRSLHLCALGTAISECQPPAGPPPRAAARRARRPRPMAALVRPWPAPHGPGRPRGAPAAGAAAPRRPPRRAAAAGAPAAAVLLGGSAPIGAAAAAARRRGRRAAGRARGRQRPARGARGGEGVDVARGGEGADVVLSVAAARTSYKEFLLVTEETRPFYYRVSDTVLTAYGAICFLTSVLEPETAIRYHFTELEDFINVSFFIKFLLLFWSNDWKTGWLFTGKALLDLASCLPVISIPVRFMGAPALEDYLNLLQIARFLRLLVETRGSTPLPLEQQLVSVLLSLLGTMTVSATVLFLYESSPGVPLAYRSFEDCLLYMVNLFAGRDLPWVPQQPLGKLVSAAATCLSIVFIPFLVSRTVELFTESKSAGALPEPAGEAGPQGLLPRPDLATPPRPAVGEPADGEVLIEAGAPFWAAAVARLDRLVGSRLLSLEEAKLIRRRCLLRDPQVEILHLCYHRPTADSVYAGRLRELLSFESEPGPARPSP
ncbi:unnamed protein product [Prorocentrum cordatum]|uniref:Ion transport domain-containing protein n=1 Tax=Prorocentrum cordatum TaxID=2364126 RepID=A0ABN9VKM0_9DINO|nr:unnamed protein product [Polarella glacialis]